MIDCRLLTPKELPLKGLHLSLPMSPGLRSPPRVSPTYRRLALLARATERRPLKERKGGAEQRGRRKRRRGRCGNGSPYTLISNGNGERGGFGV